MAIGYKINIETAVEIQFNYLARGFYCPTCRTGVENKNHKCPHCGQQLLEFGNAH